MDQIVIIHVSDLHIGKGLIQEASNLHRWLSWFNPHDDRLLDKLELSIREACEALEAEPYFLVSGDLTAGGTDNDYATAFALLYERWKWKLEPERFIGLSWSWEKTFTVPGNHDHWRHSKRPTAYSSELAGAWFEPTPWRHEIRTPGGIVLELFGVDSNSGLKGRRRNVNLGAGGAIASEELQQLEEKLKEGEDRPVAAGEGWARALVCHHAFSTRAGLGALLEAKPLEEESREKLVKLALDHEIAVVLTGHVHTFHEESWPKGNRSERKVRELRCATTLQGPAAIGVQGFWIHRVRRSDTEPSVCVWDGWMCGWGGGYFQADAEGPTVSVRIARTSGRAA